MVSLVILPKTSKLASTKGTNTVIYDYNVILQSGQWAEEWNLKFNSEEYKVMHYSRTNQGVTCTVNVKALRAE